MMQDQKRAGRSRIDQRQYRMGVCQKRGARPDILAAVGGMLEDIEHGSLKGWSESYLLCALGVGGGGGGCWTLLDPFKSRLSLYQYSCCNSRRVKSERGQAG